MSSRHVTLVLALAAACTVAVILFVWANGQESGPGPSGLAGAGVDRVGVSPRRDVASPDSVERVDAARTAAAERLEIQLISAVDGSRRDADEVHCFDGDVALPVDRLEVGRFAVSPGSGWQALRVSVSGAAIRSTERLLQRSEFPTGAQMVVRIEVFEPRRLVVQVVDAGSWQPVAGIAVRLEQRADLQAHLSLPARFEERTDSAGLIAWQDVADGPHIFSVAGDTGFRIVAGREVVVSGDPVPHELQVLGDGGWDIRGQVVADGSGEPIAGVEIVRGFQEVVATTDAGGRFVIPGSLRGGVAAHALTVGAYPPEQSPHGAMTVCEPLRWGDSGVVIRLRPKRRLLRIEDASGAVFRGRAFHKLPAQGLTVPASDWTELSAIAGGLFECAWAHDLRSRVYLRCEREAGRALFANLGELATELTEDAVVYRWQLPPEQPWLVSVSDRKGRALADVVVEVVASVGTSHVESAEAVGEYDPATASPFGSNHVQLLAKGTSDVLGRVHLRCSRPHGTYLRVRHPDYAPVTRRDGGLAVEKVVLEGAGAIRGVLTPPANGMVLVTPAAVSSRAGRPRFAARPDSHAVPCRHGKFLANRLPAGTYEVSLKGGADGPFHHLGVAIVEAGTVCEFAAEVRTVSAAVSVESVGIRKGDELTFVDTAVCLPAARTTAVRDGGCTVKLPSGTYRLDRRRSEDVHAGAMVRATALELIEVGDVSMRHRASFPVGRRQFRLLETSGEPYANGWVRLWGEFQVARTDEHGLVVFPCSPGRRFELVGVRMSVRGAWMPSGFVWDVRDEQRGSEVRAAAEIRD